MSKPWEKTKGPRYSGSSSSSDQKAGGGWSKGRRGFGRSGMSGADRARQNATRKSSGPQGESKLSKKLKIDLHKLFPGSRFWKNAGSEFAEAGISDLTGCIEGQMVNIEVKRNKGWFSLLQVMFLKETERAGAISIGILFDEDRKKVFIIPTKAMGHKGDRKRELWHEIDYPDGLKSIQYYKERV